MDVQKFKMRILLSKFPTMEASNIPIKQVLKNYLQYWKKANSIAAITSIICGALLRLILFLIVPESLSGLDTILTPIFIFILFIVISNNTQNISKPKFEIINYVPDEEELIRGAY